MAFTGNFMCTSFKVQLMQAAHDFRATGGDTFNIALYTNSASFTAATTAYTATNEITNTSGSAYVAGGSALTRVDPTSSGTTAFTDFADVSWTSASFTARGALIYNTTPTTGLGLTNPTICVLDFGSDKTVSAGTFTIVFPTADASNAIIRIA
jgi:hypothetical protein